MLYFFVDETYQEESSFRRHIFGCLAFLQDRWNELTPEQLTLRWPHNISKQKRILRLLEDTGGAGVLTKAEIPLQLLPTGERDQTDDIPDMARTDNAWSACFVYTVAALLRFLEVRRSPSFTTADIYLDNRDLKTEHMDAIDKALRVQVIKTIDELKNEGHMSTEFNPKIRRIRSTPQADKNARDRFQAGTHVAHHFCRLESKTPTPDSHLIKHLDITQQVEEYLKTYPNT